VAAAKLRFTDFFAAHGGTGRRRRVADGTKQGNSRPVHAMVETWLKRPPTWARTPALTARPSSRRGGDVWERESSSGRPGRKKTVTHERWYSDYVDHGVGWRQDSVASGDGFDTIVDFDFTADKLEFNGWPA